MVFTSKGIDLRRAPISLLALWNSALWQVVLPNSSNVGPPKYSRVPSHLTKRAIGQALCYKVNIRPPDEDNSPHRFDNHAPTSLLSHGGSIRPSTSAGRIQIFAVTEAIDGMELMIQQASGALAPSSAAIVTLPLILNVISSYL